MYIQNHSSQNAETLPGLLLSGSHMLRVPACLSMHSCIQSVCSECTMYVIVLLHCTCMYYATHALRLCVSKCLIISYSETICSQEEEDF